MWVTRVNLTKSAEWQPFNWIHSNVLRCRTEHLFNSNWPYKMVMCFRSDPKFFHRLFFVSVKWKEQCQISFQNQLLHYIDQFWWSGYSCDILFMTLIWQKRKQSPKNWTLFGSKNIQNMALHRCDRYWTYRLYVHVKTVKNTELKTLSSYCLQR